jgi:hypothetical protein
MPGTPREVAEHSLDIRANSRPVRQHLCRFDKEKVQGNRGGGTQALGVRIQQGSIPF